jgi:hypothetical protein
VNGIGGLGGAMIRRTCHARNVHQVASPRVYGLYARDSPSNGNGKQQQRFAINGGGIRRKIDYEERKVSWRAYVWLSSFFFFVLAFSTNFDSEDGGGTGVMHNV